MHMLVDFCRRVGHLVAAGGITALVGSAVLSAQVGGSISGTIADPTGAMIPGAMVTITNAALGTQFNVISDMQGHYTFPNVPVGRYTLSATLSGFKPYSRALAVDVNSQVQINITLEMGEQTASVTVTGTATQVETASTQMGQVVSADKMTTLSLNGRSYTDLLPIQPGVVPITTMMSDSIIMAGVTGAVAPSGQLNPGNVSISGQRESANGFLVNGSDVQERMNGGTSIVPNLDSIDQFRVLTNNFDAQYGNYTGGIVSVVTKSGSDAFHGSGFEFLRDSALDARNYFSPERAAFKQNQPGGTIGGPIVEGKIFFFADYQGTRTTQGIETGLIPVPSLQERGGNFSGDASSLNGTVNGQYWATLLGQRLGYGVTPGEAYYTPGCTTSAQCVFPNAVIPTRAWSSPAQHLLPYIPSPNSGASAFSTGAFDQIVRDDKGSLRVDGNSRFGLLSGYYFIDDYRLDNPYPTQQGGASVPGFNAITTGRAQLFAMSATKAFPKSVNEFHFSYMRNANNIGVPAGGTGVSIASQGFVTGPGTSGIVVQAPQFEGVENVAFNKYSIGVTTTGVDQTNGTWHWNDSLSRVFGAHSVRVGGEFQYSQVDIDPNAQFNGTFSFAGTETGSDFADFLIGVPSSYIQAAGTPFFLRNKYAAVFAQDSWRARSNLTINYGLRYDYMMPWYENTIRFRRSCPARCRLCTPAPRPDSSFPATQAFRGRCRRRGTRSRHGSASRTRHRLPAASSTRSLATRARAACARAGAFSTRRFRGCRRASCTASRRTATTTSAPRRRSSTRRSSRPLMARTTVSRSRTRPRRPMHPGASRTRSTGRSSCPSTATRFSFTTTRCRTPRTTWRRSSGSSRTTSCSASVMSAARATTFWSCKPRTPAIRRCA